MLTMVSTLLLAACILAETVRELCFKVSANRAGRGTNFAMGLAAQPLIWVGIGLWVVEALAWVAVLERMPLGLAYPMVTASFATVPLAGWILLRERLKPRQFVGAALVAAGVFCVSLSGL